MMADLKAATKVSSWAEMRDSSMEGSKAVLMVDQ